MGVGNNSGLFDLDISRSSFDALLTFLSSVVFDSSLLDSSGQDDISLSGDGAGSDLPHGVEHGPHLLDTLSSGRVDRDISHSLSGFRSVGNPLLGHLLLSGPGDFSFLLFFSLRSVEGLDIDFSCLRNVDFDLVDNNDFRVDSDEDLLLLYSVDFTVFDALERNSDLSAHLFDAVEWNFDLSLDVDEFGVSAAIRNNSGVFGLPVMDVAHWLWVPGEADCNSS